MTPFGAGSLARSHSVPTIAQNVESALLCPRQQTTLLEKPSVRVTMDGMAMTALCQFAPNLAGAMGSVLMDLASASRATKEFLVKRRFTLRNVGVLIDVLTFAWGNARVHSTSRVEG